MDNANTKNSSKPNSNQSEEVPISHQWQTARDIVALVTNLPAVLPSGVRILAQDGTALNKPVSETSRSFLQLFTRSGSIKTALLLSSRVFCPEFHANKPVNPDSKWLLQFYSPFDIAVIASLVVLYRRITKGLSEEGKTDLSPFIHRNAEIGGLVGRAIPDIGIGRGILATTIPHLALGVFMKLDPNIWNQYQRSLRLKKVSYDFELENEFWGCNHMQIASALVQVIGLGIDRAHAIGHASTLTEASESSLTGEIRRFYFAVLWCRSLIDFGKAPERQLPAEFYPLQAHNEHLLSSSERVRTMGSRHAWLDKESASLIDDDSSTHIVETEDPVEISQDLLNALLSD